MINWFSRFEAAKGDDGYWYVIRVTYNVDSGGIQFNNYDKVKRTLKEAESVARKSNERLG